MTEQVIGNKLKLMWNASTDDNTPQASLTYSINLYKDGALYISSLSNADGFRTLVEPGNAGSNLFFTTGDLPSGNYTWSVQAIDNTFLGSPFSALSGQTTLANKDIETDKFVVFPNPVTDKIYFKLKGENVTYQIIDITGKIIVEGETSREIDLKELKSGMYILKMKVASVSTIKRIIKK